METISTNTLLIALVALVITSAFFSAAETSLISLNRYRLRHLVRAKHPGAMRAARLLEKPDRFIGFILLGNNFANTAASVIATLLSQRYFDDFGLAIATGLLTFVLLVFSEVTPKTLAALRPERVAFPAAYVIEPILRVVYYPLVWPTGVIANGLLRVFGVSVKRQPGQMITHEELRTILSEAGALIPGRGQEMLTAVLDLDNASVNDIMVPQTEIVGIDLDDDLDVIIHKLSTAEHTRLPVYHADINNVLGMLHVRHAVPLLAKTELTKESLTTLLRDPYFVPEGTPLNTQLVNFQRAKWRIGLVVDEYGDVTGLVTLEDILEEIVGEFTTDPAAHIKDVYPQEDGTFLVDGGATLRDLNKQMLWELPTDGPKTLNGLIVEYLEDIPVPGTSMRLGNYIIEIVQTQGKLVKIARLKLHPGPSSIA
ncbi:MAG: HlyC/CorC family transporter [Gammaproteobacteria bacterium]|nr:HlyC/CorC family transporter [Gammaproteobacteria bacterium]